MIVGALVLARVMRGITEASATRSPFTPYTRSSGSTTAPIAQVDVGVIHALAGAPGERQQILVGV